MRHNTQFAKQKYNIFAYNVHNTCIFFGFSFWNKDKRVAGHTFLCCYIITPLWNNKPFREFYFGFRISDFGKIGVYKFPSLEGCPKGGVVNIELNYFLFHIITPCNSDISMKYVGRLTIFNSQFSIYNKNFRLQDNPEGVTLL